MRLSPEALKSIVVTMESLVPEATVYLHGSRADDTKRGGDIDLLLLCPNAESKSKVRLLREKTLVVLKERLGDQRIDLTIIDAEDLKKEAIYRDMLTNGIKLTVPS